MEKASFIPKKDQTAKISYQRKGMGLFLLFSTILLVVSGVVFGGVYFYEDALNKEIDVKVEQLKRARDRFEFATIEQWSETAQRIESAKTLLAQHKSLVPFFEFLEQRTLESVRFSDFSYNPPSAEEDVLITMSGSAKTYTSLALQAEEFQKDSNVESVSVSDLSLGAGGVVNFNVRLMFKPDFIIYKIAQ